MGELHLDIIVDRLKREFKVECNQGAPQVNYRETITNSTEIKCVFEVHDALNLETTIDLKITET